MLKETLNGKTTKELRDMAKDLNITGRWDMTKEQLIESILKAKSDADSKEPAETESAKVESAEKEQKNDNSVKSEECADKTENKATSDKEVILQEMTEERKRYISDAEIGALVAFFDGTRVRSAAITNRNKSKELLKLITKAGQEFIVKYDDILWVRTGKRWPRGIYNLLTGGAEAYERASKNSKKI